jgi:hypothetical protein
MLKKEWTYACTLLCAFMAGYRVNFIFLLSPYSYIEALITE